jgi:hypothetical protein
MLHKSLAEFVRPPLQWGKHMLVMPRALLALLHLSFVTLHKEYGCRCVFCLQIGKSGASWITQAFLLGCGSIAAAMPFTGLIFAGVIITWIKATLGLHKQMQETERARLKQQQQQQQQAAAAALGAGGAGAAVVLGAAGVPVAAAAAAAAEGEFTEADEDVNSSSSSGMPGGPAHSTPADASDDGGDASGYSHTVSAASSHVNGGGSSSMSGMHATSSSGSLEAYVAAAVKGQLQHGKAGSASSVNGGNGAQFNVNGNGPSDGQMNGAAKELSKVKLQ